MATVGLLFAGLLAANKHNAVITNATICRSCVSRYCIDRTSTSKPIVLAAGNADRPRTRRTVRLGDDDSDDDDGAERQSDTDSDTDSDSDPDLEDDAYLDDEESDDDDDDDDSVMGPARAATGTEMAENTALDHMYHTMSTTHARVFAECQQWKRPIHSCRNPQETCTRIMAHLASFHQAIMTMCFPQVNDVTRMTTSTPQVSEDGKDDSDDDAPAAKRGGASRPGFVARPNSLLSTLSELGEHVQMELPSTSFNFTAATCTLQRDSRRYRDLARILSIAVNFVARAIAPDDPNRLLAAALSLEPDRCQGIFDAMSPAAISSFQRIRVLKATETVRTLGSYYFVFLVLHRAKLIIVLNVW